MFLKLLFLRFGHAYDVIVTPYVDFLVLMLVCMGRGDPKPYYFTIKTYLEVHLLSLQAMVSTPLGKPFYRKRVW